jgi:hypothetical protein
MNNAELLIKLNQDLVDAKKAEARAWVKYEQELITWEEYQVYSDAIDRINDEVTKLDVYLSLF